MGAWSVDVFGSDDSLDFICEIEDVIGIPDLYPTPEGAMAVLVRSALEHNVDELVELAIDRARLSVLAAVFMVTGAAMNSILRASAADEARYLAQTAEEEGWGPHEERTEYMNNLAHMIEIHQPGQIVNVGHRGLFETISARMAGK